MQTNTIGNHASSRENVFKNGAGYAEGEIQTATKAFVAFAILSFFFSAIYIIYKTYYKKKYFSRDWTVKHGKSLISDAYAYENES